MPAKKAASSRRVTPKQAPKTITSGADWARDARQDRMGRPFTVPSGKTCLVAKPDGLKAFTDKGMIPNGLMPIMQKALGGDLKDNEVESTIMANPELISDMVKMVDAVTMDCVIEPVIAPIPLDEGGDEIPPSERDDDDTLYVDYIDFGDKMAIFNYALNGVTTDLAKFR